MNFKDYDLKIDLVSFSSNLVTKTIDGKVYIKDPIRKKFVILQPEEWIRQLWIYYLIEKLNYPKSSLQVEKKIEINGLLKRFDLVVFQKNVTPWILIECKAPEISIGQLAFDQASSYNHGLNAPFIIISNGLQTYCAELDAKVGFKFLSQLPTWE